jgi:hypothetical protein
MEHRHTHVVGVVIKDGEVVNPGRPADSCPWQPIETAPKDGTPILLWADDARIEAYSDHPKWGRVAFDYKPTPPCPFVGFWSRKNYWQLAHYTAFDYVPTHWMPLPEPPNGTVN